MKPIPNFPGYQITKDGRVWSEPKQRSWGRGLQHSGKWLKLQIRKSGYLQVALQKNGISKSYDVHRLVLETYVGVCPDGMECHHINSIRTDNRIENLMWVTRSENVLDSVRRGTHRSTQQNGEKHHLTKLKDSDIRVIRYLRKVAKFTYEDLAWQFDVAMTTIRQICKRKTWQHIT